MVDELKLDEIKTKGLVKVLENLKAAKALIIMEGIDKNVIMSARNLPAVETSYVQVETGNEMKKVNSTINVYDIMKSGTVVITKSAVANIEEVYA